MHVQLIRKVRDRQPTSSVGIDRSNPITRGLTFATFGAAPCNAVTNRPLQLVSINGGVTRVATKHGEALVFDGATTKQSSNTNIFGNGDCSAMFVGSPQASGLSGLYAVSQSGTDGTIAFGANFDESFTFVSGQLTLTLLQHGVDRSSVKVAGAIDGSPSCYVIGKSANSGFAYKNGVSLTVTNHGGLAGAPTLASDTVAIGGLKDNGGLAFSYPLNCTAVWNRRLSAREAQSISLNPWQIFAPETIPLFYSTVTAQYARPTSDTSTGTWTASSGTLASCLDETTASDADYITTVSASTCEVALGSITDPAVSTGHVVRYRISADSGGIIVRLKQGGTTIATWTHATAPTSLTTYAQTLTGGEADSITNYAALSLQFEATA